MESRTVDVLSEITQLRVKYQREKKRADDLAAALWALSDLQFKCKCEPFCVDCTRRILDKLAEALVNEKH